MNPPDLNGDDDSLAAADRRGGWPVVVYRLGQLEQLAKATDDKVDLLALKLERMPQDYVPRQEHEARYGSRRTTVLQMLPVVVMVGSLILNYVQATT